MDNQETLDLDRHPIAKMAEFGASVPVVDIGGMRESRADGAIQEIARACRDWGFFQVVNHGVSEALIDDVWRHTRQFFRLPSDSKASILRTRENPWGYYNNELTKNQRDRKEIFDYTTEGTDPIYHAENRWPATDGEFRSIMMAYLTACADLSLRMLEAFVTGLGLPADSLERHFVPEHTGFVRLNHYPVEDPMGEAPRDLPDADLGVHHHTDAGALTILLQDDIGGLQVHRNGRWHDISPVPGAFVINTGDMMQVWSNDAYRAPTHRALAMKDQDRYSIPFFFNPAANTRVRPLPGLTGDSHPAVYRTVDWAAFRRKRTDGDYADYGTEVQISQYRR